MGEDRLWHRWYPEKVPHHLAIPEVLLTELIEESVRKWPDRTALIYYGSKWSYRQLWDQSERLAASLAREGVGPGDRVALYLPNSPAYPIAFFGVLRLGAIVVQVSPLYLGQDLVRLLKDSSPKALVTLEILYPNLAKVKGEVAVPAVFVARVRDFYPWYLRPFVNSVLRRQKLPTEFPRDPSVRPWRTAVGTPGSVPLHKGDPNTTPAVLQYTGGTTGRPKAAVLTHRNLVANVVQGNAWNIRLEPGNEVVMASIPLFHIYGLTVALLMGLNAGGTVVLQTRPEIRELLKLIDRYQPTQFPGVPALYQAFTHQPDIAKYHIHSIKYCVSGSAALPIEVQKQFVRLTGASLVEGYGLSETSPITHVNPLVGEQRIGSIGVPIPETDQRVLDLETGTRVLGPGEVGELSVRGPQVMHGYYNQPEETALVLKDGWFSTGDVARIDPDGFAYIVDRKKDMVNIGGMKVYPREVEEVLFQHSAVADAAAVGAPDPEHGEVVVAFVVKKPGSTVTEEELIAFVKERIAHYKAPRRIEFRDALPRTGVQKVLRRVLREEAAKLPPRRAAKA
ncbi:MAG TPA: long-chain fatty acid--CoA ligase [Thermoplasmata archaeon]|jgi:long-chain acyl-CoA synthetase|nr:long-chain fatty acid--CoA ligase [Thermoplasmata archaeon]